MILRCTRGWRRALFAAVWALSSVVVADPGRKIEELNQGLPDMVDAIGEKNFIPHDTFRLLRAKIGWFNYEYARDLGIDLPSVGLTPEYRTRLLDTFAYGIPHRNDPDPSSRFDLTKKRIAWVDLYGGYGNFDAEGSGRAGTEGFFQKKGFGLTRLQRHQKPKKGLFNYLWTKINNKIHNTGAMYLLGEGERETSWGEILTNELPAGANRTLLLQELDGFDAIQVRNNPTRLGHYMSIKYRNRIAPETEDERMKELYPRLFPGLESTDNPRDLIRNRFFEIAEAITRTYATEFVKGIFHGAMSPSNIGIDGSALDFGMITAVNGFPKLRSVPRHANWQGDTRGLEITLLLHFQNDLLKHLPKALAAHVPRMEEVRKFARKIFSEQLDRDFLWRAGLPEELSEPVAKKAAGVTFSKVLQKTALLGNETPITYYYSPKMPNPGKYDLGKVVSALLADPQGTSRDLKKALPDEALRAELVSAFRGYRAEAESAAKASGITEKALWDYHVEASAMRNRPRTGLTKSYLMSFLDTQRQRWYKLTGKHDIPRRIDANIVLNTRTHRHRSPFSVVLDETYHPETGLRIRRVFDGKSGKRGVEVLLATHGEDVNYLGKVLPVDSVRGSLAIRSDGESLTTGDYERRGRHHVFHFPDTDIQKVKQVELGDEANRLKTYRKAVVVSACPIGLLSK